MNPDEKNLTTLAAVAVKICDLILPLAQEKRECVLRAVAILMEIK